jgi:uncharacterized protein (DUF2237 family)
MEMYPKLNVLGGELISCCSSPITGFFRDGYCNTCAEDVGAHTVCCLLTVDFLEFSKQVGNDLSTPRPEFQFPGLSPGDQWCVCAARWQQAYEAGAQPPVILSATHMEALAFISLESLMENAIDLEV